MDENEKRIFDSWQMNAKLWTQAIREQQIESRAILRRTNRFQLFLSLSASKILKYILILSTFVFSLSAALQLLDYSNLAVV